MSKPPPPAYEKFSRSGRRAGRSTGLAAAAPIANPFPLPERPKPAQQSDALATKQAAAQRPLRAINAVELVHSIKGAARASDAHVADRMWQIYTSGPVSEPLLDGMVSAGMWLGASPNSQAQRAGRNLLKRLGEVGVWDARFNLASLHLGMLDATPDFGQAASAFLAISDADDAPMEYRGMAAALLGDCYRTGNGVERDSGQALAFFKLGAERGSHMGALWTGEALEAPVDGAPADFSGAAHWYTVAMELGVVKAKARLGILHVCGALAGSDTGHGIRLLTEAMEDGDELAAKAHAALVADGVIR